jgi:uncharacterized membrane protein
LFAVGVSLGYTCSFCFYYLAIITYNKKFDYIRRKFEPWFHGISILFPSVISAILLATNTYNVASGGNCYATMYLPPHCIGYEAGDIPEGYSIPCIRGGKYDCLGLRAMAHNLWILIIAPVIILVTMTMMFKSVSSTEKKMQKYGVSALRHRASLSTRCYDDPESRRLPLRTKTKSNKMSCKKRAVLLMALGYAGAWLLVWTPFFVFIVSLIVKKCAAESVVILAASMIPLQGFFNFVVFMAPKVRISRMLAMRHRRADSSDSTNQRQQHLTWCQTFYKAYLDRGRPPEDSSF